MVADKYKELIESSLIMLKEISESSVKNVSSKNISV